MFNEKDNCYTMRKTMNYQYTENSDINIEDLEKKKIEDHYFHFHKREKFRVICTKEDCKTDAGLCVRCGENIPDIYSLCDICFYILKGGFDIVTME